MSQSSASNGSKIPMLSSIVSWSSFRHPVDVKDQSPPRRAWTLTPLLTTVERLHGWHQVFRSLSSDILANCARYSITIPKVVARIRVLKKMNPRFYAWQIRDQLMADGTTSVPPLSAVFSIVLRTKVDSSYGAAKKPSGSELSVQCCRHYSINNPTRNFATTELYPSVLFT